MSWASILKRYKPQTAQAARRYFVQNIGEGEEAQALRMSMLEQPDDEIYKTLKELLRIFQKKSKNPNLDPLIQLFHKSLSFFREEDGEFAYV